MLLALLNPTLQDFISYSYLEKEESREREREREGHLIPLMILFDFFQALYGLEYRNAAYISYPDNLDRFRKIKEITYQNKSRH